MSYSKTIKECWHDATPKAESAPRGLQTVSKVGIAVMDYWLASGAETYRELSEKMGEDDRRKRIEASFQRELAAFEIELEYLPEAINFDLMIESHFTPKNQPESD